MSKVHCESIQKMIFELDEAGPDEMSVKRRQQVTSHLDICESCRQLREHERQLTGMLLAGLMVLCGHYHVIFIGMGGILLYMLLRQWVAENDVSSLGDTSTLADPGVVDDLVNNRQNKAA